MKDNVPLMRAPMHQEKGRTLIHPEGERTFKFVPSEMLVRPVRSDSVY